MILRSMAFGISKRSITLTGLVIMYATIAQFMWLDDVHAAIISKPPSNLGLVAYYSFNEGTGTRAGDYSGNNNRGVLTNGPTWVDGKRGKALNFDGVDDYVDAGNPSIFPNGTSARTMCGWAMTNSVTINYRWIAAYGTGVINQAMFIGQNGTTLYGGGYGNDITASNFWSVGVWKHVCLTYDGTNATLYGNGAIVSGPTAKTWSLVRNKAYIGEQVNDFSEYWNGLIDEVRVYNRALSATEIQALYNSGAARYTVPTNTGLVGYWSFNEGAGSYANDSSGNKNTGTLTNGPTWVAGKRGKALNFDGVDDYVAINNKVDPNGNAMTLAYWIKNNGATESYIGNMRYNGISGYAMTLNNGVFYWGNGTAEQTWNSSGLSPTNGQWKMMAIVIDSANLTSYKDGIFVSTVAKSISGNIGTGAFTLKIGREPNDSYSAYYFKGSLDEVRVYNRALSATEIQALYKSGAAKFAPPSNTGLVGYWSFDDGSGSSATDFSGNNNRGVLTNGPTWVDGKRGKALSFDGSDDYVDAGSNSITGTSPFTLSAWFNARTHTDYGVAVSIGTESANDQLAYIGWVNGAQVGTNNSLGGGWWGTNYGSGITSSGWHHVVMTFAGGSGGVAKIYVDGAEKVSTTFTPNLGTQKMQFGLRTIYEFNGLIDEVRVYNRALSASEVQALYNSR